MSMNTDIERELAYLLGWSNIVQLHDNLIGYPQNSNPKREFRSTIPQYTRDNLASENLRKEYNVHITLSENGKILYGDMYSAKISDYKDEDEAKMCLIALEVMEILDSVHITYP